MFCDFFKDHQVNAQFSTVVRKVYWKIKISSFGSLKTGVVISFWLPRFDWPVRSGYQNHGNLPQDFLTLNLSLNTSRVLIIGLVYADLWFFFFFFWDNPYGYLVVCWIHCQNIRFWWWKSVYISEWIFQNYNHAYIQQILLN